MIAIVFIAHVQSIFASSTVSTSNDAYRVNHTNLPARVLWQPSSSNLRGAGLFETTVLFIYHNHKGWPSWVCGGVYHEISPPAAASSTGFKCKISLLSKLYCRQVDGIRSYRQSWEQWKAAIRVHACFLQIHWATADIVVAWPTFLIWKQARRCFPHSNLSE